MEVIIKDCMNILWRTLISLLQEVRLRYLTGGSPYKRLLINSVVFFPVVERRNESGKTEQDRVSEQSTL